MTVRLRGSGRQGYAAHTASHPGLLKRAAAAARLLAYTAAVWLVVAAMNVGLVVLKLWRRFR